MQGVSNAVLRRGMLQLEAYDAAPASAGHECMTYFTISDVVQLSLPEHNVIEHADAVL